MRFTIRLLAAALILSSAPPAVADAWRERPDWAAHFESAGVGGTIVVLDERSGARWVYDDERAATCFLPASTFKIPHALFALDAGIVRAIGEHHQRRYLQRIGAMPILRARSTRSGGTAH